MLTFHSLQEARRWAAEEQGRCPELFIASSSYGLEVYENRGEPGNDYPGRWLYSLPVRWRQADHPGVISASQP